MFYFLLIIKQSIKNIVIIFFRILNIEVYDFPRFLPRPYCFSLVTIFLRGLTLEKRAHLREKNMQIPTFLPEKNDNCDFLLFLILFLKGNMITSIIFIEENPFYSLFSKKSGVSGLNFIIKKY